MRISTDGRTTSPAVSAWQMGNLGPVLAVMQVMGKAPVRYSNCLRSPVRLDHSWFADGHFPPTSWLCGWWKPLHSSHQHRQMREEGWPAASIQGLRILICCPSCDLMNCRVGAGCGCRKPNHGILSLLRICDCASPEEERTSQDALSVLAVICRLEACERGRDLSHSRRYRSYSQARTLAVSLRLAQANRRTLKARPKGACWNRPSEWGT